MNIKQKNEQKMRFIYNAIRRGYSVTKNNNGTYTFTIDRSRDEPLKSFVRHCYNEF